MTRAPTQRDGLRVGQVPEPASAGRVTRRRSSRSSMAATTFRGARL
jgi:hypothetical protein